MISIDEAQLRLWHLSRDDLIAICESGEVRACQNQAGEWMIERNWTEQLVAECKRVRYDGLMCEIDHLKDQHTRDAEHIAQLTKRIDDLEFRLRTLVCFTELSHDDNTPNALLDIMRPVMRGNEPGLVYSGPEISQKDCEAYRPGMPQIRDPIPPLMGKTSTD